MQVEIGRKVLPWHKHYPEGVPFKIDIDPHKSIIDLFEESVKEFGPRPAFECMGTTITYEQLDDLSRSFAAYLQKELGLERGTRVAIQLPNILQYPIAIFGILRAGMVVVNTNPLYTAREMKHQFIDAEVSVVVTLANFAHKLEKILPDTAIKHVVVTEIGDQLGGLKKHLVNGVARYIKRMVPKYHLPDAIPFNMVLQRGSWELFKYTVLHGSNPAFLQYTGGTTGVSKGAVLSHANMVANVEQFSSWIGRDFKKGEELIITALPLYHIMALMGNCLTIMKFGGNNVLVPDPRNMKGLVKLMKKHPFSTFSAVNTLYNALLNQSGFEAIDFSNLKFCAAGGMAVQTAVAARWKEKTGVPIIEGYGLTETSPILTFNIPVNGKERVGTVGVPMPSTELMIADDEGREVPIGIPGEIYARGPQVMSSYYKKPEETAHVFTKDGWFKTGDIGVMDDDNFVRIVDRKKEMILVSGFNVYPNEVEDVISRHGKVKEVGAVGVPDDKSGEVVKIFVVKKEASLTEDELLDHCKQNLTAYKVPKHITFKEELPKSNVGKILRRLLKEEH